MARLFKLALLVALLAIFVQPHRTLADSSFRTAWRNAYPTACATLNAAVSSCDLCHDAGGPPDLNPYGSDLVGHLSTITQTNNTDSDGDGRTNIQEIGDCTLPGDAASVPAEDRTWGQIKSLYQ